MLEDTEDATSECVYLWAHWVETQSMQKSALNEITEAKDFDVVKYAETGSDHINEIKLASIVA